MKEQPVKTSKPACRDADATRASIMDAAEEEFARFGLQGTRTEAIAAQTGVTKAMIHYYFESKENLYREVLRRVFARRAQQLDLLNLSSLEPLAALEAIFVDLLDEISHHPTMAGLLFLESLQNRGKYYREISVANLYLPMIEVLERGISAGVFRADLDPRHTAVNLVAMAVFYVCSRENLSSLWPDEPDLLSREIFAKHTETTISMVCSSVLMHQP